MSIRVLLVIDKLTVGGTQRHILNLLRYGDRDVVENDVLCLMERGALADEAEKLGARVFCLGMNKLYGWQGLAGFRRFAQLVRRERYDITVNHLFAAYVLGSPAARLGRVPCVLASRRQASRLARRENVVIRQIASRFVHHFVANSEAVAQYLTSSEGVARRHISIIHGGVDTQVYRPDKPDAELAHDLGLADGVPVVATVARLDPVKGFQSLLEGFARLLRSGRQAQLLIVGDGPMRNQLEADAKDLKIAESVIFAGKRREISPLLALADVFVLASKSEGLSNALMEAAAAGKASVATAVGGNLEIVEDGRTGLLVEPGDSKGLGEAIGRLLDDNDLRENTGRRARERIVSHFDVRRGVRQMEKLYAQQLQVIQGNRSA